MDCPKCGKFVEEGRKFCKECGANLIKLMKKKQKFCPVCNTQMKMFKNVCKNCGYEYGKEKEKVEAEEKSEFMKDWKKWAMVASFVVLVLFAAVVGYFYSASRAVKSVEVAVNKEKSEEVAVLNEQENIPLDKPEDLNNEQQNLTENSVQSADVQKSTDSASIEQKDVNETSKSNEASKSIDGMIQAENIKNKLTNLISKQNGTYSVSYLNFKDKGKFLINSKKMPAMSLAALFVMVEAYSQMKDNVIKEDTAIILKNSMKVGGAGSVAKYKEGTLFTVKKLIELMITESDNTAMNMLIDLLNMENINRTASRLGCNDTQIQRKTMDYAAMKQGKENYTSVRDTAIILGKMYLNQLVGEEYDPKMIEILKKSKNNLMLPKLLPKGISVAHKTGEYTGIEHDAGLIMSKDKNYVFCVMSTGVNVVNARNFIAQLSEVVYNSIK